MSAKDTLKVVAIGVGIAAIVGPLMELAANLIISIVNIINELL